MKNSLQIFNQKLLALHDAQLAQKLAEYRKQQAAVIATIALPVLS